MKKKKMPACLGRYERGDAVCDGLPKPKSDEDGPCLYRDRCVAFRRFAKTTGSKASELIELKKKSGEQYAFSIGPDEDFQGALSRIISKFGIVNGRVTKRSGEKKKPKQPKSTEAGREKSTKSLAQQGEKAAAGRKQAVEKSKGKVFELAAWFTKTLSEQSDRPVGEDFSKLPIGGILLMDRTEKSNYIGLYAKMTKTRKLALCNVNFMVRSERVQVRIALELETYKKALSKENFARFAPEEFSDGAFHCRVKNLDREGAAIVAESIARGIEDAWFDLPELED